jgi:hypothetical protein
MLQARNRLERYLRSRRSAAFYALGKLTGDDWEDISATWNSQPVVNPETDAGAGGAFHLWTIDNSLALAVVADRDARDRIEDVFGDRLVARGEGAYVFASHAVGACYAPDDAAGFAQVCNIAMKRMVGARAAMAKAAEERAEADMDFVLNEWKIDP